MDKISGIIPSSARVRSVDMSEAHSIRPGMPSHGAPVGTSSLADTFSVSPMASWKSKDLQKAGIVSQVTDTFFQNRMGQEIPTGIEEFVEDVPVTPEVVGSTVIFVVPPEESLQEESLYPDETAVQGVDYYAPEPEQMAPQPQLDIYA